MFANVASGAAKEPLKQDLMEGVDEDEWVRTAMVRTRGLRSAELTAVALFGPSWPSRPTGLGVLSTWWFAILPFFPFAGVLKCVGNENVSFQCAHAAGVSSRKYSTTRHNKAQNHIDGKALHHLARRTYASPAVAVGRTSRRRGSISGRSATPYAHAAIAATHLFTSSRRMWVIESAAV